MRVSAEQRDRDRVHMARCLELAAKYRGRTAPNPIVGAVITSRSGEVLAEGVHRGPGKKHAEIDALANLKKRGHKSKGTTLYVNLEPCNHHGRTPPCAPAVREAEFARIVVGTEDPIPGHGGGLQLLRRAGMGITVGILRDECERANRPFFTYANLNRPSFTLKAGITLDGKIATVSGQSKWITGEWARADVMRLRDEHDAVLVGIGTVLADDPWLTARIRGARDPKRIILDSQLRTPPDARVLPKNKGPQTIIACSEKASEAKERALVAKGAEVWRIKTHRNGQIDLYPLSRRLAEDANIRSVLVEGGGEVHAYMLEYRYADELVIYIAPKAVGGPAKSWVGGKGLATLGAAYKFIFESIVMVGPDLRLTAIRAPDPVYEPRPDLDE